MNAINYWWTRFQSLRTTLKDYREKNKLKDVEDCVEKLLIDNKRLKFMVDNGLGEEDMKLDGADGK